MTPAPLAGITVVDGVRPDVRRPAPRVGEHNKEVLGE
jgi:crotonobetainyl-CoA:carnitine CoA-transferase CaiB-like acyl-CoA transferase